MSEQFAGFELPKENWSKLPHSLIDHLYLMTSEAEVKVVLYILRHTWGFGDDQKKITIDEFCNGRKRKDGNRLDNGTGLSENSVKDGITRAVKHGFIEVSEDATDAARIKRFYQLRGSEVDPLTLKSGGQKLTPWGSEVDPRTEKETNRNKPSKEASDKSHSPNGELPPLMTHSHTPLDLPLEPGKKSPDKNGLGKATNGSRKTEDGGQAALAAPGPKTVIRDKFCQLTNLAMPGLKTDANFWWSQFGELHRIGGGGLDLEFTLAMVEAVVTRMKEDRLTISGPQSIVNLCRTFAAEHSQNGNGNGYAKPVLEKAKDGGVYV